LVESAVASGLVCEASEAAAFFLVFFLAVVLLSVCSVEPDDPDCCAARAIMLPKISSMAAKSANTTPLLDFTGLSPSARSALQSKTHYFNLSGGGIWWLSACRAGFPSWNARIIPKKEREVKVKWQCQVEYEKCRASSVRKNSIRG